MSLNEVFSMWGGAFRHKSIERSTPFSRSETGVMTVVALPDDNSETLIFILFFHHEGVERLTLDEFDKTVAMYMDRPEDFDPRDVIGVIDDDRLLKATLKEWKEDE